MARRREDVKVFQITRTTLTVPPIAPSRHRAIAIVNAAFASRAFVIVASR